MPLHLANDGRRVSYAQSGEDIVLLRAFADQAVGRWVDVGANHPENDSVTKNFYDLGWTGINVEPIPSLYQSLVEQRPRDVNIQAVVSSAPGRMTFHRHLQNPDLSTLDDFLAAVYRERGDTLEEVEVDVVTLTEICAQHLQSEVIDFMKIDTEGHELQVLAGHDFERFPVRALCAEATWDRLDPIVALLKERSMDFVNFDGLNAWFVRSSETHTLGRALSTPANIVLDWFHPWVYLGQIERLSEEVHQLRQNQRSPRTSLIRRIFRRLRQGARRT